MTDEHGRRIVAVVVTFNRLELLQRQLQRLAEVPELDEVLVIDNASTDGTGEWLRTQPVTAETLADEHRRRGRLPRRARAGGRAAAPTWCG